MSILFADDTTLTATNNNITSLFQQTNSELEKVTDWFLANKLALHPAKCKFILFFPPNSSEIPTCQNMGKDIERVHQSGKEKFFKYVGIHLDERLTFQSHIQNIELKITKNLAIMKSAKRLIPLAMKKILYNALIKPYLEYGAEIWGATKKKYILKLRKLNRRAIRVVFGKTIKESLKDIMQTEGIPNVKMIHKFALMKIGYEISNKICPSSIGNCYDLEDPNSRRLLNIKVPRINATVTKNFPITLIPKQWNDLEDFIRNTDKFKTFKRKCKLHLINLQYNNS